MSDIVIRAEGLGKKYTIGHEAGKERYRALRDVIARGARNALRKAGDMMHGRPIVEGDQLEEVWALRDVNFEFRRGEVVGIIGSNGAGKSTLLKILSRITEPSEGEVSITGRVASLLEVGTGFHPELTGRENIFLNGAILGMSRDEVRKKFDEIAAFAEIDRYLDTPVKRYSSGMYMRLGFSVAAHLEPDILLVDEVLAVGDVAFQKKCLGKMQDVSSREGKTVLFVSHNLDAVRRLCRSAMLLSGGRVEAIDNAQKVVDSYFHGIAADKLLGVPAPDEDIADWAYVTSVAFRAADGSARTTLAVGEMWSAKVGFKVARDLVGFVVSVGMVYSDGRPAQTVWCEPMDLEAGEYCAEFRQETVVLSSGAYNLIVGLTERERAIQQFEAVRVDIIGDKQIGYYQGTFGMGVVLNSMAVNISRVC